MFLKELLIIVLYCCGFVISEIQNSKTGGISKQKCSEYSQAYNKVLGKNGDCWSGELKHEINENNIASENEFPHMALLGYYIYGSIYWGCMGTLISEEYVLTAAYCLHMKTLGPSVLVRIGGLEAYKEFNVSDRIVHPDFKNTSNYNDIGLIRLDDRVKISQYIRPICLPDIDVLYGLGIWTGVNGITERSNHEKIIMKKIILDIFQPIECHKSFFPYNKLRHGINDNLQFCAGSKDFVENICLLNGGPLQIPHSTEKCMHTIIGTSSFGIFDCGINGYSRIFSYISWIEKIVWSNRN